MPNFIATEEQVMQLFQEIAGNENELIEKDELVNFLKTNNDSQVNTQLTNRTDGLEVIIEVEQDNSF